MKQKIVIKVSMPAGEKSRSKAMAVAAKADGVISVAVTGDAKDRLEVVGDSVDAVCLTCCLRRKLGHAEILQVDEVKDKKPDEKKPVEAKVEMPQQPSYYYYHHPPPMVVCEEQNSCLIM